MSPGVVPPLENGADHQQGDTPALPTRTTPRSEEDLRRSWTDRIALDRAANAALRCRPAIPARHLPCRGGAGVHRNHRAVLAGLAVRRQSGPVVRPRRGPRRHRSPRGMGGQQRSPVRRTQVLLRQLRRRAPDHQGTGISSTIWRALLRSAIVRPAPHRLYAVMRTGNPLVYGAWSTATGRTDATWPAPGSARPTHHGHHRCLRRHRSRVVDPASHLRSQGHRRLVRDAPRSARRHRARRGFPPDPNPVRRSPPPSAARPGVAWQTLLPQLASTQLTGSVVRMRLLGARSSRSPTRTGSCGRPAQGRWYPDGSLRRRRFTMSVWVCRRCWSTRRSLLAVLIDQCLRNRRDRMPHCSARLPEPTTDPSAPSPAAHHLVTGLP